MDATTAIARYLTAKTAIDARLIGPWNDGETFVLPGGVQGSICRAVPDRSIVNGVVYADAGAVVEAKTSVLKIRLLYEYTLAETKWCENWAW